ncbi:MAG: hypothetical protein L3J49_12865 [Desulfobulbaceae bacterium]|nr:hypothetical protein [Desulfobulbaceae bacterium]
MIFVDGHVHIYDCFDVDLLFAAARDNFNRAAGQLGMSTESVTPVLLLTEGATDHWYGRLLETAKSIEQTVCNISADWDGCFSPEMDSLMVYRRDNPEEKLYLIAGRQIVTAQSIEVLALFCSDAIQNGLSLEDTIATIRQSRGIPVLPWGAGKLLGKRGRRIREFLLSHEEGLLFLGDNGGRPKLWPTPTLFTQGLEKNITLLPGTDPLPLPDEALRVGSFGFYLQEDGMQEASPVASLRHALCSGNTKVFPFGELLKNRVFLANQLRLRFSS